MNPSAWRGLKYPDSELVGLLYRFARPGRDVPAGAAALDVACGPGRHVRLLQELGYDALGLDADADMVATARANGVPVEHVDAAAYPPVAPPALVVCWGFMMLVPQGRALIASWRPQLVIADWRTPGNDCYRWPINQRQPDGGLRLSRPDHTLDGQVYYFHTAETAQLPGYERVWCQTLTKLAGDERHEWLQTVHRRTD